MGIRPTYTGILGLPSSRLGSLVPGVSYLWAGPGTFDCNVHVIAADKIRVLYNDAVTNTALNIAAYTLTSLAPLGTAVVPAILSVSYYDETGESVVLQLDKSLTYNTSYSLNSFGVMSIHDEEMLAGSKNFTANVLDPAIAIGAWQSKRGCIDILFNKSVGPTSSAAAIPPTFFIRDASVPGPGVDVCLQLPWVTENIPETVIRIQLPAFLFSANSFVIDFTGVVDVSLNTSDNTVPITLSLRSSVPYSYASLVQLQITDAFITDISNDGLDTGNIRVYFNGPVSDADNEVNWVAYQNGVHTTPDTANDVTSPDPINWAQLYTLANEIKLDFNNHIIEYHSHPSVDARNAITSPDATTPASAYILVNEAQIRYLSHLIQPGVHLYDDTYHDFAFVDVTGSLSLTIFMAKRIRDYYNDHAQILEYPLVFSNAYGPTITAYTKYLVSDSIMNTVSPYTSYADLRFYTDTNIARIRLEATLLSEDGGSSTTPVGPSAYTGSITARSRGADSAHCLFTLISPENSILVQFDRNIITPDPESLQVIYQNKTHSPTITTSTSLPSIIWALNNAITIYNMHIATGSSMHKTPDILNNVSSVASLPISSLFIIANNFKTKFNAHIVDTIYHYFRDANTITTDDATDLISLDILTKDIQKACIDHITQPSGPHLGPGNRMISAPINDILILSYSQMVNDDQYSLVGKLQSVYHDNKSGDIIWQNPVTSDYIYSGTDNRISMELNSSFIGLAVRPSLASVVPRIGLVGSEILKMASDAVEFFFSKSMYQVALSPSNISISGGSILQREASWISSDRASVRVIDMGLVSYTAIAIGLTDVSGNPIY